MEPTALLELGQLVTLMGVTPGRRIVALRKIRELSKARDLQALAAYADRAIAQNRKARELDLLWAKRTDSQVLFTPRMPELAHRLEVLFGNICDFARAQTRGAAPGDSIHAEVRMFLSELYPAGIQALIAMPYAEEIAAAEGMIAKMGGPLAGTVSKLGLTRQLERLKALVAECRAELAATTSAITYAEMRAAKSRGHIYLIELISMIIGTYYDSDNPAHLAARAELLAPIIEQIEAVQACRRTRQLLSDIDPDTGAIELAPAADAQEQHIN